MTVDAFAVGSTVVQRHLLGGRVMSAYPCRVLADDGDAMRMAHWPGVRCQVNGEWATFCTTGQQQDRDLALAALGRRDWELVPWTWNSTVLVYELVDGRWFSINRFHDPATGALLSWYVNFQRPFVRVPGGIDTLDLLVDLVVGPDLSWAWKDEDEYAHGRRMGLVTDAEHREVEAARELAVAMIEGRDGPFGLAPEPWAPDPAWPDPKLPPAS